jgi:hypothetical protein
MGIELTTSGFYALELREKADSSKNALDSPTPDQISG